MVYLQDRRLNASFPTHRESLTPLMEDYDVPRLTNTNNNSTTVNTFSIHVLIRIYHTCAGASLLDIIRALVKNENGTSGLYMFNKRAWISCISQ